MKKAIYKAPMVMMLLLSLAGVISCNKGNTDPANATGGLTASDELYFYKDYHTPDFVKKSELKILRIVGLDTLIYLSSDQFHGDYEEIHGKLTKVNDSILFVRTFKHVMQSGNGDKPVDAVDDAIFFYCDSTLINTTIRIEYLNGDTSDFQIRSTINRIPISKKYFNEDYDRLYLEFDVMNPIVKEKIEIVSKYNDPKFSVAFDSHRPLEDFYVIVRENSIQTLNLGTEYRNNLGPKFELDRMPRSTKLRGGRKLYEPSKR